MIKRSQFLQVLTTPSINVELYKQKYEQQGDINEITSNTKKKKKSVKRNRSGRISRKGDRMEFTNVVREYEESKTLVDMLQYMMALNNNQVGRFIHPL